MCRACGGVATVPKSRSALFQVCNKTVAAGSVSRRDKLSKGRLVGFSRWPDGRPGSLQIHMVRYSPDRSVDLRAAATIAPSPCSDSEPEGPRADLTAFHVADLCSEEQAIQVAFVLDTPIQAALESSKDNWEDFSLPEDQLLVDLQALNFTHENMRAALKLYIDNMDQLRNDHPVEAHLAELQICKVCDSFR